MVNRNIQMKKRNNDEWENLFPLTLMENVFDENGLPLNQSLTALNEYIDNSFLELNETIDTSFKEVDENIEQVTDYSTTKFNYLNNAKKEKKPIVSFIADDSPKNDLTHLMPIIRKHDVPLGIGVITDWVGKTVNDIDFMTWEDIEGLKNEGVEILSHTNQHRYSTQLSTDELERDIKKSKDILTEKGFIADGFVYPYSDHNQDTIDVISKYYKYSFSRSDRHGNQNFPSINNNAIARISMGSFPDPEEDGFPSDTLSLDYYKARVDWAIENNNWLVFTIHTARDYFPEIQQQYLNELIYYIRGKDIDIVSPREGFERYGNIIDMGNVRLASDGLGNFRGVHVDELNNKTDLTPIHEFDYGKITITPFTRLHTEQGEFYPAEAAGVLKTHYFAENTPGLMFQTYEGVVVHDDIHYIRNLYSRYWMIDENRWSFWKTEKLNSNKRTAGANSTIDVKDIYILVLNENVNDVPVSVLENGKESQEITFLVTASNGVLFRNSDEYIDGTLFMKESADKRIGVRQSITFKNISGYWVEV